MNIHVLPTSQSIQNLSPCPYHTQSAEYVPSPQTDPPHFMNMSNPQQADSSFCSISDSFLCLWSSISKIFPQTPTFPSESTFPNLPHRLLVINPAVTHNNLPPGSRFFFDVMENSARREYKILVGSEGFEPPTKRL